MSTETTRLIRDGENVGEGGGGMEVGDEGGYILVRHAVTTRICINPSSSVTAMVSVSEGVENDQ